MEFDENKYLELNKSRDDTIDYLNQVPEEDETVDYTLNPFFVESETENLDASDETEQFKSITEEDDALDLQRKVNFMNGLDYKPDKIAEGMKLKEDLGLDFDLLEKEIPQFKIQKQILEQDQLSENLSNFLNSNAKLSAMAKDDYENLYDTDIFFGWLKAFGSDLSTSYQAGFSLSYDLAKLQTDYVLTRDITPEQQARINDLLKYQQTVNEAKTWLGDVSSPVVHFVGVLAGMAPEAIATSAIGGAIGAGVGYKAGAPGGLYSSLAGGAAFGLAGASAGLSISLYKQMILMSAGRVYYNEKQKGVSDNIAQTTALVSGLTEAMLARFGYQVATSYMYKPLQQMFEKSIGNTLSTGTRFNAGVTFMQDYLGFTSKEMLIGQTQEMVSMLSEEVGLALDENTETRFNTFEGRAELGGRMIETAKGLLSVWGTVGLLPATIGLRYNLNEIKRSKENVKRLDELTELSAESKIKQRDEKSYIEIVNHISENTNANKMYIDGEAFFQSVEETGADIEKIKRTAPDVAEAINKYSENGGDIVIRTGDYLAHFASTELGERLKEHVRFEEERLSEKESNDQDENAIKKELDETVKKEKSIKKQLTTVKNEVFRSIKTMGIYDSEASNVFANLVLSFIETQSQETEVSPEEFYKKHKLRLFSDEQIRRMEFNRGRTLKDSYELGRFMLDKNIIVINQHANFDTFIHEVGHYFFETLMRLGAEENVTDDIYDHAQQYLGVFSIYPVQEYFDMGWQPYKVRMHENFAYNFTRYLFEGVAPTPELKTLYRQLSNFLMVNHKNTKDITNKFYYQMGYDITIDREIDQVFDRLLANKEAIQSAIELNNLKPLFVDFENSGMTAEEWEIYKEISDNLFSTAIEELYKTTKDQVSYLTGARNKYIKSLQIKNKKISERVKREATKNVNDFQVYRAITFLQKGIFNGEKLSNEHKISIKEATEALKDFSEDQKKEIIELLKSKKVAGNKNTLPLAELSDILEYRSVLEMITDVAYADKKTDTINTVAENNMQSEQNKLMSDFEITDAADVALSNKYRARMIAVEINFLNKSKTPIRQYVATANALAKDIVFKENILDINPKKSLAKDARFGRLAESSQKKGDAEKTLENKYKQLLQSQITIECINTKKDLVKFRDLVKEIQKSDAQIAKKRDIAKVNQARAVLAQFGLISGVNINDAVKYAKNITKHFAFEDTSLVKDRRNLGYIHEDDIEIGLDVDFNPSEELIVAFDASQPFEELSVDKFYTLKNMVSGLWQTAKRERQIRVGDKYIQLTTIADNLNQSLKETHPEVKKAVNKNLPTKEEKKRKMVSSLLYLGLRAEHFFTHLDKFGDEAGVYNNTIYRPVQDAVNNFEEQKRVYGYDLAAKIEQLPSHQGKINANILAHGFTFDNKMQLITAIANSGTVSNLTKLLVGREWGEIENGKLDISRWNDFLENMISQKIITKKDLDFVQEIWNTFDKLKVLAQRAFYEMNGYYFKEVPARPFVTSLGRYKGGYVNLKVDPNDISLNTVKGEEKVLSDSFEALEANLSEAEKEFTASIPTINTGFTKSRKNINYMVSLEISGILGHIEDILKYTHLLPVLKDTLKIFKEPSFKENLNKAYPGVLKEFLIPWIDRVASQNLVKKGISPTLDKVIKAVQRVAIDFQLGGNLKNVAQQITGLSVAVHDLGFSAIKNQIKEMSRSDMSLIEQSESIVNTSTFMSNRLNNTFRLLYDVLDKTVEDFKPKGEQTSKIGKLEIDKYVASLQHYAQSMVDMIVWKAKYNQTKEKTLNPITDDDLFLELLNPEELHKEAVQRADSLVRMTQDSYNTIDQPKYQEGTPAYRMFTRYSSYQNNLANYILLKAVQMRRDLPPDKRNAHIASFVFQAFFIPSVADKLLERLLYRGFTPTDEEDYLKMVWDTTVNGMVDYGLSFIPILGSLGKSVLSSADPDSSGYGNRAISNSTFSMLESAGRGIHNASKTITTGELNLTGAKTRDYFALAALLLYKQHLPMGAMSRPSSYVTDVVQGKVEPTWWLDGLRGLLTGKATEASKE